jgi:methylmalonyl-CoA mutase, N-terminal domain
VALRTLVVVAHATDGGLTAVPLAGSWFVESLTDEIEARASDELARIDQYGGAVEAIESGHQKREIEKSAYELSKAIDGGEQVVVGVNRYRLDEDVEPELQRLDEAVLQAQVDRLNRVRGERDEGVVNQALADVAKTAASEDNLLPAMREALRAYATVGEVCDALRDVFGQHRPADTF